MNPLPNWWKSDNNHIIGDSLKIMDEIPDNTFDLIIADPPYNIGKNYGKLTNDNMSTDEYLKWCELWISKISRVAKENSSLYVFGMHEQILLLANVIRKYFNWKQTIVWIRSGKYSNKKNFTSRFETLLYYVKGEPYFEEPVMSINDENRRMTKASWERIQYGFSERNNDTEPVNIGNVFYHQLTGDKNIYIHQTRKPFKLIEVLIKTSSKEGDMIFDPFLGTGTTIKVARRLNRIGLGCEIEDKYIHDIELDDCTEVEKLPNINDNLEEFF